MKCLALAAVVVTCEQGVAIKVMKKERFMMDVEIIL